jgi:hypothetical protein
MRQIFFLLLLTTLSSYSQNDSIVVEKVNKSWYFRAMPISLASTYDLSSVKERLTDRTIYNIEVGKSVGVIDFGLCYNRLNVLDSINNKLKTFPKHSIEGKITMDACQFGSFSNEITLGAGYIFDKTTPILLEISSTIFTQLGDNWGVGAVYGDYLMTGNNLEVNRTFMGLFLRYGLIRDEGGFLLHRTKFTHKTTKTKVKHLKFN